MRIVGITQKKKLDEEVRNLKEREKGIYFIYASKNAKKFVATPISRCGGKDKSGLLYIGRSVGEKVGIAGRLRSFFSYIKGEGHTHSGGTRYKKHLEYGLKNPLTKIFPQEKLFYTYEINEDPTNREQELLSKYFSKFGEVPPLNSQLKMKK